MPHAGVLVNYSWQATVIEAFKQVMQRPPGSPAATAAVTAAEGPEDSAADVAAAAEDTAQQIDEQGDGLQDSRGRADASQYAHSVSSSSIADSAAESDPSTGDTDDTAWETVQALHAAKSGQLNSCSCLVDCVEHSGASGCSCNCINCRLFPLACELPDGFRGLCDGTVMVGSVRPAEQDAAADVAADADAVRSTCWTGQQQVRDTTQQLQDQHHYDQVACSSPMDNNMQSQLQ